MTVNTWAERVNKRAYKKPCESGVLVPFEDRVPHLYILEKSLLRSTFVAYYSQQLLPVGFLSFREFCAVVETIFQSFRLQFCRHFDGECPKYEMENNAC